MPQPTHDLTPGSVRTPSVLPSCAMCGTPLQGRQTVCSAKCRIARSRQRRNANQQERDAMVRLHLRVALDLLNEEASPPARGPRAHHPQ